MSKPPDFPAASLALAVAFPPETITTKEQAERKTGTTGREVPGADDPALRFQLGAMVMAEVHTHNAALPPPHHTHHENSASFFKLIAWGSSWASAVACWKRQTAK